MQSHKSRSYASCLPSLFLCSASRVETSYVTVEPKRRRQAAPSPSQPGIASAAQPHHPPPPSPHAPMPSAAAAAAVPPFEPTLSSPQATRGGRGPPGRELRRARIVITVKRTETYKQWLEDNPLQAVIAADGDEDEGVEGVEEAINVDAPRQNR